MSQVFPVQLYDRVSVYVADMDEHASLDETMEGRCDFGTPVVAANSTLLGVTAIIAAQLITLAAPIQVPEPFGRTLNITGSGAGTVIIQGRDYLGQPMTELVTLATNTVSTLKAFKFIDSILSGTFAANVSIGPGTMLGLPFVASAVAAQYNDGLAVAAPTVTPPVTTTPTNATGDTRGKITPTGTLNGVMRVEATIRFNDKALGGLYGQKQA